MQRTSSLFERLRAAMWCGLALVLPAAAGAQPPTYSYAYLNAGCNGGTMQIVVTAYDRGEHPEFTGFHVYRRTLGTCAAPVRVTAAPVPRAAGTDYTLTVNDPTAAGDLAHEYHLMAVDSSGVESDAYGLFSVLDSQLYDIASCSPSPPIAAGFVEDWGWALAVTPCPAGCFAWALLEEFPPELRALAGTGTPVLVYGWFGCGSVEGCLGHVTTFTTGSCQVGVQERTWGGLKRLYR